MANSVQCSRTNCSVVNHSSRRRVGVTPTSLAGALALSRQHNRNMSHEPVMPKTASESFLSNNFSPPDASRLATQDSSVSSVNGGSPSTGAKTPEGSSQGMPSPNLHSRNISTSDLSSFQEEWETPPETLTVFDLLDNLALPARLEQWQTKISVQTERVRRQRERIKSTTFNAKDRVVEEWRRRLPPPEEQLDKYRKRMRDSVDRLGSQWNDTKAVTVREKLSFIAGVLNIFISGWVQISLHLILFWRSGQVKPYWDLITSKTRRVLTSN